MKLSTRRNYLKKILHNVLRACAVADKKEDLSAKPSPAIEQARCYAPAVSYDNLSSTLSFDNGTNFHISPVYYLRSG